MLESKRIEWGKSIEEGPGVRSIVTRDGKDWMALVSLADLRRIEEYDARHSEKRASHRYGQPWTPAEDAALMNLGLSDEEVAKKIGRHIETVKRRREKFQGER